MASVAADYKGRTKGTQAALDILCGARTAPVHIPNAGVSNFIVCPSGSLVEGWDINVAPSSGGVTLAWANGTNGAPGDVIVQGAVLARTYSKPFYCPWSLLVSTPGNVEDVTFYVAAPGKGVTID